MVIIKISEAAWERLFDRLRFVLVWRSQRQQLWYIELIRLLLLGFAVWSFRFLMLKRKIAIF